ncbi:MAG: hypothetical protein ACFFAS_00855 [Promethearchaeota archaeon]
MIEYVKICGLKQAYHVKLCSDNGADAIGFVYNVSSSPRNLEKIGLKTLLGVVPSNILSVIVLKPSTVKELEKIMDEFNASLFQIHPKFDISDLKTLSEEKRKKIIIALKVYEENENYIIGMINKYKNQFFAFLIDNSEGEGNEIKVSLVQDIIKNVSGAKVIIAGGINEDNVEDIVNTIKPFGIDASSSLESEKGIKSPLKIKKFLKIIENMKKREMR